MKIKIESPQVLLSEGEGFAVRPADIYIEEDKIISVGEKVTDFVPDRTIDGTDKLVIPGLINMHTHNYMTVFRNLADDVSFNEWLFERVMPREDKMTPEDAYLGATLGIMDLLQRYADAHSSDHEGCGGCRYPCLHRTRPVRRCGRRGRRDAHSSGAGRDGSLEG